MKYGLIIEDNEDNCVLITRILNKAGYKTRAAETGEDGFDAAVETNPDFILLDIQLPDMNGVEVLKKIRKTDSTKEIPIIVVTSYAMSGDREHYLQEGANGYIEKPIDPLKVVDQINQVLGSMS